MTPPNTPKTDDPTLAVVVARLDDLRSDVASLRTEVQTAQAGYVIRAEFEAWRTGIGREIGDVKASVARVEGAVKSAQQAADQRRAPWWAVSGVVVSLVVGLAALVPQLAK